MSDNNSFDKKFMNEISFMSNNMLSQVGLLPQDKKKQKKLSPSNQGNSTLDNSVTALLDELIPAGAHTKLEEPYLFEVVPWIATLAATNALTRANGSTRKTPALKNRYSTLKKENASLFKMVRQSNPSFGRESIVRSRAYYYSKNLVQGNKYLGKHVLGELVTSLDGTSGNNSDNNTDDNSKKIDLMENVSDSIDLLNILLEQFSVTNLFNSINDKKSLLTSLQSDNTFEGINKLKYESDFSSNLETEIKNFIRQIYDAHPFTKEGISLYLKPLISRDFNYKLAHPSHKLQITQSDNYVGEALEKIEELHGQFEFPTNLDKNGKRQKKMNGTLLATKVISNFNKVNIKQVHKAVLTGIINNHIHVNRHITNLTINDFLKSPTNKSLVDAVDNDIPVNPQHVASLFIALDTYLAKALLGNADVKTTTYPLQKVTNALKKFDDQMDAGTLDASTFSTELSQALTDDSNKIIDYFKQWNENFADLPNSDLDKVKETVAKIRPILNQLNQVTNHTSDWENIINN